MKKHLISTIAIIVVLAVVLVSFGQEERTRQGRGFMGREERMKAIEAIEAQLAKLKEGGQRPAFNRESFQDMSEDERAKFREQMTKVRQEQQKIYQAIMGQLAGLQGRREPAPEGAQYLLITTADLKPIQEAAAKEKAEETGKLLARMAARGSGRGFGGRRPGTGQGGQRGGQQ
ncbi:MAG TPA: hypothetical protein VMX36_07105 [Sedimentisphaerales bacterium]|nr:hypothetical protein [Sedimentisphaerales bacterium]